MILEKRIPIRYLISKIRIELIVVTIYSMTVQFLDETLQLVNLSIPIALPALLGTAISLILAFRIGQSYDRWWEARKIWGSIVNDSRTLVRQLLYFAKPSAENPDSKSVQRPMAERQIAWCYILGETLRRQDTAETMRKYLPQEEINYVSRHSNIPNALLLLHSRDIEQLKESGAINAFQQVQLDSTVARLCDWMGMAERIKNTVFPKQYSLIVAFLLYLFVILLPFGIIEYFHSLEGMMTIVISAPFFMLEKTALYLQDPFDNAPTDVAVTDIASTIETNIRHAMDERYEKTANVDKFYLM